MSSLLKIGQKESLILRIKSTFFEKN